MARRTPPRCPSELWGGTSPTPLVYAKGVPEGVRYLTSTNKMTSGSMPSPKPVITKGRVTAFLGVLHVLRGAKVRRSVQRARKPLVLI